MIRREHSSGHATVPTGRTVFSGTGHTLGSDEVESQVVPDPAQQQAEEEDRVVRHIVFWRNGFTIEDGPLNSYDDPASAEILRALDTG